MPVGRVAGFLYCSCFMPLSCFLSSKNRKERKSLKSLSYASVGGQAGRVAGRFLKTGACRWRGMRGGERGVAAGGKRAIRCDLCMRGWTGIGKVVGMQAFNEVYVGGRGIRRKRCGCRW